MLSPQHPGHRLLAGLSSSLKDRLWLLQNYHVSRVLDVMQEPFQELIKLLSICPFGKLIFSSAFLLAMICDKP